MRRCDHVTPVLRQLQSASKFISRLPIVFSRHWLAKHPPIYSYLADDCRLISDSDRRKLRSSDIRTCVTPRTSTRFSDRSFSAAGPQVWNGLPSALRAPDLTFDLRPICLHWCDEISAPNDYWFLALYKSSLCMCVCMYIQNLVWQWCNCLHMMRPTNRRTNLMHEN